MLTEIMTGLAPFWFSPCLATRPDKEFPTKICGEVWGGGLGWGWKGLGV